MAEQWLKDAVKQFVSFVREASTEEINRELEKTKFDNFHTESENSVLAGIEEEVFPLGMQVAQKTTINIKPATVNPISSCNHAAEDYTFAFAA